jgi:hypothetical protein
VVEVVGCAEVGTTDEFLVEPVEDGRLADSSNIFVRVNEKMKWLRIDSNNKRIIRKKALG